MRWPLFESALVLCAVTWAHGGEIRFKRTQLHGKFISEGVTVADVDGDGRKDILAGPLWFESPSWRPHEIEPVKEFFPEKGYSESFLDFVADLNGDGRPDLIVIGMPGGPARIYENPGRPDVHWKRRDAFPGCGNETPAYEDVNGDGKREIVCGVQPEECVAWFRPAPSGQSWDRFTVSPPKSPGGARFYHGLGVGDVDSDGRADIVTAHGWYRSPPKPTSPGWKFFEFPEAIRGRAVADLPVLDVDGDGDNDILASSAHARGIWWYEQRRMDGGSVQWEDHDILSATLPEGKRFTQTHALELADINGDGLTDFVTGKRWFAHQGNDLDGRNPEVVLYWFELGRTDGKVHWKAHRIDDNSGVGTQFVVEDINGDDLLDIAVSNKKGVFYFEQERP